MLGYIKPNKNELKVKEVREYQTYYCALCHALQKEFGFLYRLILSNDCTFLLLCLNALSEEAQLSEVTYRCPGKPFRRQTIQIDAEALHYAACINYYFFLRKIQDEALDARSKIKRGVLNTALRFFKRKKRFRAFEQTNARLLEQLDAAFALLYQYEEDRAQFDQITNQFGALLALLADGFFQERGNASLDALKEIFFNVGKWIYVADALDDFEKDEKRSEFNLLQTLVIENTAEERCRTASYFLLFVQEKFAAAFPKVSWHRTKGIIHNILFDGTAYTLLKLIKKTGGKDKVYGEFSVDPK